MARVCPFLAFLPLCAFGSRDLVPQSSEPSGSAVFYRSVYYLLSSLSPVFFSYFAFSSGRVVPLPVAQELLLP